MSCQGKLSEPLRYRLAYGYTLQLRRCLACQQAAWYTARAARVGEQRCGREHAPRDTKAHV